MISDADILPMIMLALCVISAWSFKGKWAMRVVSLIGLGFLLSCSWISALILGVLTPVVYLLSRRMRYRSALLISVLGGLSALFFVFKISAGMAHHLVPLGLSYYLFRQVHYVLESYKGNLRRHGFEDFVHYQWFMPVLLVGPIHRFPDFLNDLRRRRWDKERFVVGLNRVFWGYVKAIFVGNYLISFRLRAVLEPWLNADTWHGSYLDSVLNWFNLYIQFSGYSDIAIGVALMCGFTIIENFNQPWLAKNISDFWKRWHISLTSWCNDYIYTPVIAVTRTRVVAVFCTMMVIGLWHELSLRYLFWGVYHVLGIYTYQWSSHFLDPCLERRPRIRGGVTILGTLITLNFVVLSYPVTSWVTERVMGLF